MYEFFLPMFLLYSLFKFWKPAVDLHTVNQLSALFTSQARPKDSMAGKLFQNDKMSKIHLTEFKKYFDHLMEFMIWYEFVKLWLPLPAVATYTTRMQLLQQ